MKISKHRILKILNSNKQTVKREKKGKKKEKANNSVNHKKKINLRRRTLKLLQKGGAAPILDIQTLKASVAHHEATIVKNRKKINSSKSITDKLRLAKHNKDISNHIGRLNNYIRLLEKQQKTQTKKEANKIKPRLTYKKA